MSSDGQSFSIDGSQGVSAAIAERSPDVAWTLENPGTDGNQSETPLLENDEQPASAKPSSAAPANAGLSIATWPPTVRSTECPVPIKTACVVNSRPLAVPLIAGQPWQSQGRFCHAAPLVKGRP